MRQRGGGSTSGGGGVGGGGGSNGFRVEIEPGSLRRLLQASRTWDAVSKREMRAGLRAAAGTASDAAKSSVLGPPPSGGTSGRSTGLRSGLAKGVKVSIRGGRESSSGAVSGEGVRVTASGGGLPGNKQPMVKAYMKGSFRHPVFGGPGWASQRGKNWFYRPLRAGQSQYQQEIVQAIDRAAEAVARG
jgi:hypothetical protein